MRALRFKFEASNNQAEYEAIIAGMELARDLGVPNIEINSDSQLVNNQIKGEYGTINLILAKYCDLDKPLLKNFEYYELNQVMRENNVEADNRYISLPSKAELAMMTSRGHLDLRTQSSLFTPIPTGTINVVILT